MAKPKSKGIEGIFVETHNWKKSVAFWKQLGFELVFETNHHSGQLKHPDGGPYIFLAERPPSKTLEFTPVIGVVNETSFKAPRAGKVLRPFQKEHWGVMELQIADPDERMLRIQAPLKPKKSRAT